MNDRFISCAPHSRGVGGGVSRGKVLIIRRARAPLLGHFGLPGRGVEIGETMAAALARELIEEVGVEAEIVAFNRHIQAIIPEGDRVRAHFVIASFVGRWPGVSRALATKSTPWTGSIRSPHCPRRRRRSLPKFGERGADRGAARVREPTACAHGAGNNRVPLGFRPEDKIWQIESHGYLNG
jgi:ADP-ribose pyrophosphatase YjhB (NUDIX family)